MTFALNIIDEHPTNDRVGTKQGLAAAAAAASVGKQAPARFYGYLSEQVGCSGLASAFPTSPRIRWARKVSSYDEFVG